MKRLLLSVVILMTSTAALSSGEDDGSVAHEKQPFQLLSNAFQHGGDIPNQNTCVGEDLSPLLSWLNPPSETKSFAISMIDPDTMERLGYEKKHWFLWNIPPNVTGLSVAESSYPQGTNDNGKIGYSGPCPPTGRHHYYFVLYALDIPHLNITKGATFEAFNNAISTHVLQEAVLMGRYQKPLMKKAEVIQPTRP